MFDSFFQLLHSIEDAKVLFEFCPFQEVALIVRKVSIRNFGLNHTEAVWTAKAADPMIN